MCERIYAMSNMSSYGGENSVVEFYNSWFHDGCALWDRVGVSTGIGGKAMSLLRILEQHINKVFLCRNITACFGDFPFGIVRQVDLTLGWCSYKVYYKVKRGVTWC